MKKLFLTLHAAFAILLGTGCSEHNEPDISLQSESIVPELKGSPKLTAIRNYLEQKNAFTRGSNVEITPFIENGDTLMFLAQYSSGWELFSNSTSAPMVLMKSETGYFQSVRDENPAFSSLYESLNSLLKSDKDNDGNVFETVDKEWGIYNHVLNNSNDVNDSEDEGIYTLVGTKTYPTDHKVVNHLIQTHWYQNSPCNMFMPFQKYKTSDHILVGCTAVATGQFLYYSHNKWGTPTVIPSSASYNSSSNQYDFINPSTEHWSDMVSYPTIYDKQVALFLGWIAKEIKATPHYSDKVNDKTSASLENACKFIVKESRIPSECVSYDLNKVADFILNDKPVILWLLKSDGGHTVVIDAIDYTKNSWDYYYAYVKPNTGSDPTKPIGPDTGTTDDYNYLVNKYGKIYTESYVSKQIFFKFNWGYYFGPDEVLINGAILNISSDIEDINGYKFYQIINYTIN